MTLDEDYKLPRTVRNYKGQEVANLYIDAYPPTESTPYSASNLATPVSSTPSTPNRKADSSSNTVTTDTKSSNKEMVSPTKTFINLDNNTNNTTNATGTDTTARGKVKPVMYKSQSITEFSITSKAAATTSSSTTTTTTATTPNPPVVQRMSLSSLNQEWNRKWSAVLPSNANIIYTSLIVKRNKLGLGIKRQLLLTDIPSLFYVDGGTMSIKGDVEWPKNSPPQVKMVSHFLKFILYILTRDLLYVLCSSRLIKRFLTSLP
jgi:hypothetical protein